MEPGAAGGGLSHSFQRSSEDIKKKNQKIKRVTTTKTTQENLWGLNSVLGQALFWRSSSLGAAASGLARGAWGRGGLIPPTRWQGGGSGAGPTGLQPPRQSMAPGMLLVLRRRLGWRRTRGGSTKRGLRQPRGTTPGPHPSKITASPPPGSPARQPWRQ